MPTRIELLKQAGFSDSEIGDWATAERRRMLEAGFNDSEIDDEFGVTRPPKEVPAAFIERLTQGNWFQRILGAAGESAQNYFGDESLGFSPEHQRTLRKFGLIGNLTAAASGPLDAARRSLTAGIAGVGAGLGQAYEEGHDAALGPGPEAKGKAARDFAQFADIASMFLGTGGLKARAIRTPRGNVVSEPIIALPRAEDFRNAAAAISGTQASFKTEQKLLRLWNEHGIAPTEVAQDALRDRTIAENIRSDSEKLPDVYAGSDRTAATGAPNAPAQLAEAAQADGAAVPAESRAALTEADDKSSASLNAPQMIAEAKRVVPILKPPLEPQRSFAEDYATAPKTGERGQLLTDIEGRSLVAKFIAGRRRLGKADEPLRPEEIKEAISEAGIGLQDAKGVNPITGEPLPRAVRGLYYGGEYARTRPQGDIYWNTAPNALDRNFVIAHEFGHAIDELAGHLSPTLTMKEELELRFVYRDLRGWKKKNAPMLQPENFGYRGDEINPELVAEGFRAYLTNPNYFKTAAPTVAAKFRAAVNDNPLLKHAIQFNTLGAIGLMGAGVRDQDRDDQ